MAEYEDKDKILILTVAKDAEEFLSNYFKSLFKLTYSHNLISIGFLEGDSVDNTYPVLKKKLPELNKNFRSAGLWKEDFGFHIPPNTQRWARQIQIKRRTILAKSRNHLLFHALNDEDWVLWLDADLIEYPSNIIEKLLETGKDIVQPNCVSRYGGKSFDSNAWRDQGKYHMHDLRKEGDLVKLHAVGGCMLWIKADIHRDGLIFPPFPYGDRSPLIRRYNYLLRRRDILKNAIFNMLNILWTEKFNIIKRNRGDSTYPLREYVGEIETEGLGIMANSMGYECWGMPNLEILHRDS